MKRPMQSVINVRIVPRRGVGWAAIAVTCLVVARPVAAQGEYSLAAPATLAIPTSLFDQDSERERQEAQQDREREQRDREREERDRQREREASSYDQGMSALDSAQWDRAASSFDRVIELKGTKADAALYWKAYAQNKQGQRAEALGTIAALMKQYPKSRYLEQAKALEMEVRRDAGQPVRPESESDEEMKLIRDQRAAELRPG